MPYSLDDAKKVQDSLKAPFVRVDLSLLGGVQKTSIMIIVSLDAKETWKNGILHNSRYMQFMLDYDGTLEQHVRCFNITTKFRKCKAKSVDDAVERINNYLAKLTCASALV